VDGVVAGGADHEGLAPFPGHEVRPLGLWPSWPGEVGELADLMNFHHGPLLAPLAPGREEPADQLLAAGGGQGWLAVIKDRFALPPLARNGQN
jgi:hypothetical protein